MVLVIPSCFPSYSFLQSQHIGPLNFVFCKIDWVYLILESLWTKIGWACEGVSVIVVSSEGSLSIFFLNVIGFGGLSCILYLLM